MTAGFEAAGRLVREEGFATALGVDSLRAAGEVDVFTVLVALRLS